MSIINNRTSNQEITVKEPNVPGSNNDSEEKDIDNEENTPRIVVIEVKRSYIIVTTYY